MKIRLAICLDDRRYADKLSSYFLAHYGEGIDVYNFSESRLLQDYLRTHALDVLLVEEGFDEKTVANRTELVLIRLVIGDNRSDDGVICLAKYQRADAIYREILHLCSQRNAFSVRKSRDKTTVVAFCSAAGGTGASTVSAAFGIQMARQGVRVLYMNLEDYGDTSVFFDKESKYTFEEILLALKTKNRNLSMKLQSAVSKTPEDVHFYASCDSAVDMSQMTADETEELIKAIRALDYKYLIIDFSMGLDPRTKRIMNNSDRIIIVSDGSPASVTKFNRIYQSLERVDSMERTRITDKLAIFSNRIDGETGIDISDGRVSNVGGIARISAQGAREIAHAIAGNQNCFSEMINDLS